MSRSLFQKIFYRVLIGFCLLGINPAVISGELYKWKDEKGVVHYSEKPPENQKAEALSLDKGANFKPVTVNQPILMDPTQALRHILLVKPESFWDKNSANSKITYYFGGDCVSPSNTTIREARQFHSSLFPNYSTISNLAHKTFRSFNYNFTSTSIAKRKLNARRFKDSVLMYIEPISLDYSVCAKDIKNMYKRDKRISVASSPKDFSPSQYKNRRAIIGIQWTLVDSKTNSQLFQGTSFGSADHWHQDVSYLKVKTIREAFVNAAKNLMANEKFVENIIKADQVKKTRTKKKKERGFLDSISDFFVSDAVKKTHFANVLVKASPLKTMVVEYYMSEGEWPVSASTLGLEVSSLTSESYIDAIEFEVDGTIVISVSEEKFSEPGVILLKPTQVMSGLNIEWTCLTDVDSDYYDEHVCQSL